MEGVADHIQIFCDLVDLISDGLHVVLFAVVLIRGHGTALEGVVDASHDVQQVLNLRALLVKTFRGSKHFDYLGQLEADADEDVGRFLVLLDLVLQFLLVEGIGVPDVGRGPQQLEALLLELLDLELEFADLEVFLVKQFLQVYSQHQIPFSSKSSYILRIMLFFSCLLPPKYIQQINYRSYHPKNTITHSPSAAQITPPLTASPKTATFHKKSHITGDQIQITGLIVSQLGQTTSSILRYMILSTFTS